MTLGVPAEIWGDGSIVRDYIYIDDIVSAFRSCILHSRSLRPGNYNIGTGKGHSLNQVIDVICEVTGLSADVKYRPARPFDVHRIVLDPSKLNRESGWYAKIDLLEGIRRMNEAINLAQE